MEWLKINDEGEIEFVADEVRLVPEVQALLTLAYNKGPRDADGRKKLRAKAELKYAFLVYSMKSPYRDYTETERIVEAKADCGLPADWKESKELKEMIEEKFKKGNGNKVVHLLGTVHRFVDKFEAHLNNINLEERKQNGDLVHSPKEIMDTLARLPKLAETLQELENQAKTGIVLKSHARGDHEVGWMGNKTEVKKTKRDERVHDGYTEEDQGEVQ